jgi:hypothetical protein
MGLWHEAVIIDGSRIDPNVTDAIQQGGAVLTSTMDGAESLELTVADPDMRFLRSGALTRKGKPRSRQQDLKLAAWQRFAAMRLSFDGVYFRFAGCQFNYDEPPWSSVLTFESEAATLMRLADKPMKSRRGQVTRALFIYNMAIAARGGAFSTDPLEFQILSADPFQKQDIAKVKDDNRDKGISPQTHLTIKGLRITPEQRRNITISLTEADKQIASERVMLAMLVAGIGESGFRVIPNSKGSDYGGVFQGKYKGSNPQFDIGDTKGMAHSFLVGGKGFQAGGAIKLAAANSDMTPGTIAYKVEGDISNFSSAAVAEGFYQQHITEAKNILAAWGGAGKTVTIRENYEYRAGSRDQATRKRENYWDASGRLMDEVRWRRFVTRNVMWLGPDEWFFKNKPTFVIDGGKNFASQGLLGFTGDADVGMPVSELKLRVVAPRWTATAGKVFEFDAPEMPLDGRWLIWDSSLDLTQSVEITQLTLRRPAPTKKEPAPTVKAKTVGAAETPGDLAYPVLNRRGKLIGTPGVGTHYRGQNWQSSNAIDLAVPIGSTLVAVNDGVISPPGTPYSGFGDTGQGGRFAGKRLHLKTSNNAWFYTHMSEITVKAGDEVKKGDIIGKSGQANGVAHLHIAIERGDPKKLLGW